MTVATIPQERSPARGRHLDGGGVGSNLARIRPALFAQIAMLVFLIALIWPASLGGSFGVVAIAGRSMEPTYTLGEVVMTWKQPAQPGDVILYRVPEGQAGSGNPVIHRIVGGDPGGWVTKGDNVPRVDPWTPSEKEVLGVAQFRLPLDARVIGLLRSWWFIALWGGLAVALLLWPDVEEDQTRPARGRHRRR